MHLCQCNRVDPKLMSQMILNCTLNNFLHRLCSIDSVWIILCAIRFGNTYIIF